ncbi:MAG: ribosome small subunit-dependent GTPase A [Pseudomonadota bacterium]
MDHPAGSQLDRGCGLMEGRVVAAYGRRFEVETPDGARRQCVVKAKRRGVACGDRVRLRLSGEGEGMIEEILPRKNLLYRSDPQREKLIAANVTQVLVLVAPRPPFNEGLLNRCLVAAEAAAIPSVIVLNKIDLAEEAARLRFQLALYEGLGYPVVPLSAQQDASPLRPYLEGRVTVLVGPSGTGKSTLVNALVPGARAATGEISEALDAGRHTTTHARLYHLGPGSDLIDSPGMQAFGLSHLEPPALAAAFPEFRPHLGVCRFNDCRHLEEPDCAVRAAVERGEIDQRRLAIYQTLMRERLKKKLYA